jgi:hypothetical protein
MAPPSDVCPECGTARPRRAAGCPRCGHIFQDVPAAEASLPAPGASTARAAAREPHPDDARAESGGGCSSCLLLLAICTGLTLLAGVALYVLVRGEVREMSATFQRELAQQDLGRLGSALEGWAEGHGGHLPDGLGELEVPGTWLVDPWEGRIRYEPADDRRSARLSSLGADREPGGEDLDADLERIVTLP